ncbi:hypothetical protein ASG84_24990 [Rhodococcus sp. Leaf278]|nr:hypothetical protein ASG84_24990 [Rhodococcus sp. Leaf278]
MIEGHDAHGGRQSHLRRARDLGHSVESGCRVFEVLLSLNLDVASVTKVASMLERATDKTASTSPAAVEQ